jgi:prephenate dehydrogenase
MTLDKNTNILIIGLGLLGGSYAMALKKRGYKVNAITKKQEDADYAMENNMADCAKAYPDPELIKNADLIIFALYPGVFIDWVKQYGSLLPKNALITDVTGVKSAIIDEVNKYIPSSCEFIAAHPMAGREASGIRNADDKVFEGANYIVVATEKNTEGAIEICKNLGKTMGFGDISVLDPESHDKMIAFLSQLTHCLAVALMCASDNPDLNRYTGDSFRDLTRIANINDEMWSELFLLNREALLGEMDAFKRTFDKLYDCILKGDRETMREMMRLSTKRRKGFNKR